MKDGKKNYRNYVRLVKKRKRKLNKIILFNDCLISFHFITPISLIYLYPLYGNDIAGIYFFFLIGCIFYMISILFGISIPDYYEEYEEKEKLKDLEFTLEEFTQNIQK